MTEIFSPKFMASIKQSTSGGGHVDHLSCFPEWNGRGLGQGWHKITDTDTGNHLLCHAELIVILPFWPHRCLERYLHMAALMNMGRFFHNSNPAIKNVFLSETCILLGFVVVSGHFLVLCNVVLFHSVSKITFYNKGDGPSLICPACWSLWASWIPDNDS